MFRKPKKNLRKLISTQDSDDENEAEKFDEDDAPRFSKSKSKAAKESKVSTALLSFGDDEEGDGEVFQVKKSSQSKKLMKQLDRERRKKKKELAFPVDSSKSSSNGTTSNQVSSESKSTFSNNIQTEIRTDDFVLVVKKTETPDVILNGRAALCAGKDDVSSDEEDSRTSARHKFSKPDEFKMVLESGAIPDAAMIHAARKRRQKARELGDFIPLEENHDEDSKRPGKRTEELADNGSEEDEERVDMSDITGKKDLEERRERFYQAQEYDSDDSDAELKQWEDQQIRKGVTGSQLQSAQNEAPLILQGFGSSFTNSIKSIEEIEPQATSTAELLKQAYARSNISRPKHEKSSKESKAMAPKTPAEILEIVSKKLAATKESHRQHLDAIEQHGLEIVTLKFEAVESAQIAPIPAAKYRFYQEIRCFLQDLVECFDEKIPVLTDLETRYLATLAKFAKSLIERRRQDIRDQAKEMAESTKHVSAPNVRKNDADEQSRQKRAAEREGRRTRRRRDREKSGTSDVHLDGMSSDDEVNDQEYAQYLATLQEIGEEARGLFEDTSEEFCRISLVLGKIEEWKRSYPDTYNDTFVQLCLPRIVNPLVRTQMLTWNPLSAESQDFESMDWFRDCMNYAVEANETESSLLDDTDSRLVPTIVEKVVLPRLNELVENVWDPLSTSETFRLVKLLSRLGRDYPSLRPTCKTLRTLFSSIQDKMKVSVENDVFIPLFPKQVQEARSSFFQRQFCSGLKLFRNILSFQAILADDALQQLAILSLLNRYLLLAMRACSPVDASSKAHTILYTLPRAWITANSPVLESLQMFITVLHHIHSKLDQMNPQHVKPLENLNNILKSLYVT